MTKSGLPSPLKSPIATERGLVPTLKSGAEEKEGGGAGMDAAAALRSRSPARGSIRRELNESGEKALLPVSGVAAAWVKSEAEKG
ncbi:MAG: hypothetical protein KME13_11535 [Myxacorys californica WJT36-NPBG1]|nr:hypothetical protein [Myxacorys californica WJT36-NPBG1]